MSRKILIVGAGLAGLALAKALEIRGMDFDLVDKAPDAGMAGGGIYLPGNAARALAKLEVLEQVAGIAHRVERQVIQDSRGAVLHDMDVRGFWLGVGPCLSLSRGALVRILRASLKSPILGAEVQAIDGRRVSFSDGRVADYDLVVGADGLNSSVRAMLFGGVEPDLLPQRCWRFVTENSIGLKNWTVALGKERALLGIPIETSGLYVYADVNERLAPARGGVAIEDLRGLFADFDHPLVSVLAATGPKHPIQAGRLAEIPARDWISGTAILIGDAAHASSPSMAQGGAMAFEDAGLLASCLGGQPDIAAALANFAARRHDRVRWVQKQCHKRDATRSMPGFLRNAILRWFGDGLYQKAYTPLLTPFEAAD